jgi:hypothetical protein
VDSTVTCTTCKAGFYGDTCESVGDSSASHCDHAVTGKFDKSSGELVSCDPCAAGYKGATCSKACGDGKYGAGCTQSCEALDGCDSKVPPPDSFGPPHDCC